MNKEERYRWAYRNFIKEVDDYFTINSESEADKTKVEELLTLLTERLNNIEGKL